MRCEEARVHISREVDGALPEQDRAALRRHLDGCSECQAFTRDYHALQRLLHSSETPAPPAGYWLELSRRRTEATADVALQAMSRLHWYKRIAFVAVATAALSVLIAVCLYQGEDAGRSAPSHGNRYLDPFPFRAADEAVLHMPPTGTAEQAKAFGMLADYFKGGLRWLAQDGAQMELGVGSSGGGVVVASVQAPLVLELALVRLGERSGAAVVSAPVLIIMPNEEAVFRLPSTDGVGPKRFNYRCRVAQDSASGALVSVELEFVELDESGFGRLCGHVRLRAGERVPLAYSRVGQRQYALVISIREQPASPNAGPPT